MAKKKDKIQSLNISTIEIDLSDIEKDLENKCLEEMLIDNVSKKRWIFNCQVKDLENRFRPFIERKVIQGSRVPDCPIYSLIKVRNLKSSYFMRCACCEFFFGDGYNATDGSRYIECTGRQLVSEISDLNTEFKLRIKKYLRKYLNKFETDISYFKCPHCGHGMGLRTGKFGSFLACSYYPYCKFTVKINDETGELLY